MPKPQPQPEAEILRRITVRLILPEDRTRFDQLLEVQHYLHSARLGGQSLRYVAELDGQWIALIGFSAPTLNLKAPERWIRWPPRQRARRRSFVVNNRRLLVRSDRLRYPNWASRVLSLCLKRLNTDWQNHWAHPVLLLESFVDESQYRGTCYRACGFAAVGCSSGYGRSSRDFYVAPGQPKQLDLRQLRQAAAALWRRGRRPAELTPSEESLSGPCPLRAPTLSSLRQVFQSLGDRRHGHGLQHTQLMEQELSVLERLASDGKTLRGSGRSDGQPLQLLSAVSHRLRLTVAQEPIQEKSNEIPARQPLLKKLPLGKTLVTADARHCQQDSARLNPACAAAGSSLRCGGNAKSSARARSAKVPSNIASMPAVCASMNTAPKKSPR